MSKSTEGWRRVYDVVRAVPEGRVASYGQVAALAGMPGAARQVGWALNALDPGDDVPWHRVLNAKGEISARGEREVEDLQRALLEAEGVEFDPRGRVDLATYGWAPRSRPARSRSGGRSAEPSDAPRKAGAAKASDTRRKSARSGGPTRSQTTGAKR